MNKWHRRLGKALPLAAALALITASPTQAQDSWASKPVRLIVPYPAGGPVDYLARQLAFAMTPVINQQVVVDNRSGGNAIIGTQAVATSAPDGLTIGMVIDAHAINPALVSELPYDTLKDFAPVMLVSRAPMVVTMNAGRPYKNFAEVVAASKKAPQSVSYGVSTGTLGHLMLEQLQALGNFKLLLVSYRGAAPALQDALGGQIDMTVGFPNIVMQQINAGRLRAMGVSSEKRWHGLPNTPTFAEQGFPGYSSDGWFGIVAPAATPPALIKQINASMKTALMAPEVKNKIEGNGLDIAASTPEQFGATITSDVQRWQKIVRENNIKVK